MVPTLINGDLLICRSVQHDRIVPGDIIVFSRPSSPELIVHRVIGKTACGFYTRGDNVPVSDPGLVAPHRISGVCGHVERKGKIIRVSSGWAGMLHARFLPWRSRLYTGVRAVTRPLYHNLCRNVIRKGCKAHLIKTEIASFRRPDGIEWKLLWKGREIGHLPPGKTDWKIRKPYLFLVNEELLPRRDAP